MESSNDRKSTTKSPDYLVFSIILNVVKITRPLRSYRTPNGHTIALNQCVLHIMAAMFKVT